MERCTWRRFLTKLAMVPLVFAAACKNANAAAAVGKVDGASGAGAEGAPLLAAHGNPSCRASALFDDAVEGGGSKVLVAFFSRSGENYSVGVVEKGSTQIVVEVIAKSSGTGLFQTAPVKAYPEGYKDTKTIAKQERDSTVRPELVTTVDFDAYDVVYLGYPIWYGGMPMAVYVFLESYDFSGKTIDSFCTHAGSCLANTVVSIQTECPSAAIFEGFAIPGVTVQNDLAKTKDLLADWLAK